MKHIIFFVIFEIFLNFIVTYETIELSSLRTFVNTNFTTLSGISSGAFFANQLQIDYSSLFIGAGIIAGGPFYCAQGQMMTAVTTCMNFPDIISLNTLIDYAKQQEKNGKIDSLSNLEQHKSYVYSGTLDSVVKSGASKKLYEFYKSFMQESSIVLETSIPSEHAWINSAVTGWGNSCGTLGDPYVNVCPQKNITYEMLNTILNNEKIGLRTKIIQPNKRGISIPENMFVFSQKKYFSSSSPIMDDQGYIYVPNKCKTKKCLVHLNFHGCNQYKSKIGDEYVIHNDLNDLAELNDLIIIYPQATSSFLKNPQGCWDWYGYINSDYALKTGVQPKVIRSILQDIGI